MQYNAVAAIIGSAASFASAAPCDPANLGLVDQPDARIPLRVGD